MMWVKPALWGHDDHEGRSLSPKGHGPKAFGSTMHDAHLPRHFRAPGDTVKYDVKTNPSVWLEDYRSNAEQVERVMISSSSISSQST
jgi:hypothetical protein